MGKIFAKVSVIIAAVLFVAIGFTPLKAHAATNYTITFVGDYGTLPSTKTYGEGMTVDFTKFGISWLETEENPYKFGGWYADSALTTKLGKDYIMPGHNVTVYARYLSEYTLSFETNTDEVIESEVHYDSDIIDLDSYVPETDESHIFVGWFLDEELTISANSMFEMPSDDTTLYAKYIDGYTLVFNSNSSSGETSVKHKAGDVIDLNDIIPTPDSALSEFLGWYTDENLTTKSRMVFEMPSNHVTLYAKWKYAYNLILHTNTSDGNRVISHHVGDSIDLSEISLPSVDYPFSGWYLDSACSQPAESIIVMPENDLELYAKWIKSFNVKYETDGGTSIDSSSVYPGASYTLTTIVPHKSLYVFTGWYEDSECTILAKPSYIMNYSDVTFYAGWRSVDFDSRYIAHSDNISDDGDWIREYKNNALDIQYIGVPGATKIEVNLQYSTEANYDYLAVIPKKLTDSEKSSLANVANVKDYCNEYGYSLYHGGTPITDSINFTGNNFIVNSDCVTFIFCSDSSACNYYGYYATLRDVSNAPVIHFNTNGGTSVNDYFVTDSQIYASEFDVPEKSGFIFDGWYYDSALTSAVPRRFSMPSSDLQLYAKWKQGVTITYRYYDTTWRYAAAITYDIPLNAVSRVPFYQFSPSNGFRFSGVWYYDKACTEPVGDEFTPSSYNLVFYTKCVQNFKAYYHVNYPGYDYVTVTSIINGETYSVTNYLQGYYSAAVNHTPYAYRYASGSFQSLDMVACGTHDGKKYIHIGWYEDSDCTTPVKVSYDNIHSDLHFYAGWKECCAIDYVTNVSNVTIDPHYYLPGDIALDVIPSKTITKAGYEFTGWYEDSNCTIPAKSSYEMTSNIKLYAGWRVLPKCMISYNTNGGGSINSISYTVGTVFKLTENIPYKAGYAFDGWYEDSELTIKAKGAYVVNSNMTFYAKYSKIPSQSSYLVDGSTFNQIIKNVLGTVSVNESDGLRNIKNVGKEFRTITFVDTPFVSDFNVSKMGKPVYVRAGLTNPDAEYRFTYTGTPNWDNNGNIKQHSVLDDNGEPVLDENDDIVTEDDTYENGKLYVNVVTLQDAVTVKPTFKFLDATDCEIYVYPGARNDVTKDNIADGSFYRIFYNKSSSSYYTFSDGTRVYVSNKGWHVYHVDVLGEGVVSRISNKTGATLNADDFTGGNNFYIAGDTLTVAILSRGGVNEPSHKGVNIYVESYLSYDVELYTEADNTYMNCDSSHMFEDFSSMRSLDLSEWNAAYVAKAQYMFDDCDSLSFINGTNWDLSNVQCMDYMFNSFDSPFSVNASNWDVSGVSSMSYMFNSSKLTSIDVSNWDVSNVADMNHMFYNCDKLTQLDLSNWDVSSLNESDSMFSNCDNLTSVNLSGWHNNNIKNFDDWFYNCTKLTSVDASNLDTSSATSMHRMFAECKKLSSLDVSNWDVSNVTNMGNIFDGCNVLSELDVSNWNVGNVTNMYNMFAACKKLPALDVSGWNVGKVTNMSYMFYQCEALSTLDVSNWDVSNVTNMTYMFSYCQKLPTLDVSNWNVGKVTNMSYMFYYCYTLPLLDVSNWDVSNVTNMRSMFYNCQKLPTLDVSNWNVSNVTNMRDMFYDCHTLSTLDVSNWNVGNVTDMNGMFYMLTGNSHLSSLDVSNWNVGNVTTMGYMFYQCEELSLLDVSNWDVGNVTDMSYMFIDCEKLPALDVSGWNVGKVTDMTCMFYYCQKLSILDVSGWNVGNVTNMNSIFGYCPELSTLDVSNWNVGNVINMNSMFLGDVNLSTLDVSDWNVGKVTKMSGMFAGCEKVSTLDVSNWNVGKVTDMSNLFNGCKKLTTLDISSWKPSSLTSFAMLFGDCESLKNLDVACFRYVTKFDSDPVITGGISSTRGVGKGIDQNSYGKSFEFKYNNYGNAYYGIPYETGYSALVTMFGRCNSLQSLDLSDWTISTVVTGESSSRYFYYDLFLENTDLRKIRTPRYLASSRMDVSLPKPPSDVYWFLDDDNDLEADSWVRYTNRLPKELLGVSHTLIRSDMDGFKYPPTTLKPGREVNDILKQVAPNAVNIRYVSIPWSNYKNSDSIALDTELPVYVTSGLVGDPTTIVAHSDNVNDAGNRTGNYQSNKDFEGTITIPNATKLTVTVRYGFDTGQDAVFERKSKSTTTGSWFTKKTITEYWYECKTPTASKADTFTVKANGSTKVNATRSVGASYTTSFKSSVSTKTVYASILPTWDYAYLEDMKITDSSATPYTSGYNKSESSKWANNKYIEETFTISGNSITYKFHSDSNASGKTDGYGFWISVTGNDAPSEILVYSDSTSGIQANQDASYMFSDLTKLENVELDWFRTKKTLSMCGMFAGCTNLEVPDFTYFDTSKVTDMSYMFACCDKFVNLDLRELETGAVTDMAHMFGNDVNLEAINFDNTDTSHVAEMSGLFIDCEKLNKFNVSNFNTSSAELMDEMFKGCKGIEKLDLSNWDTSYVYDFTGMFQDTDLKELDISQFSVVGNAKDFFKGSEKLEIIKTPKVITATNEEHIIVSPSDYYDTVNEALVNLGESVPAGTTLMIYTPSYKATYNGILIIPGTFEPEKVSLMLTPITVDGVKRPGIPGVPFGYVLPEDFTVPTTTISIVPKQTTVTTLEGYKALVDDTIVDFEDLIAKADDIKSTNLDIFTISLDNEAITVEADNVNVEVYGNFIDIYLDYDVLNPTIPLESQLEDGKFKLTFSNIKSLSAADMPNYMNFTDSDGNALDEYVVYSGNTGLAAPTVDKALSDGTTKEFYELDKAVPKWYIYIPIDAINSVFGESFGSSHQYEFNVNLLTVYDTTGITIPDLPEGYDLDWLNGLEVMKTYTIRVVKRGLFNMD